MDDVDNAIGRVTGVDSLLSVRTRSFQDEITI